MIDKNTILKFVKHVHKRGQGVSDRRLLHPQRDWLIGVGVFVVAFGAATVASIHVFGLYKNIDQQIYEVNKELPKYQEVAVTTVLETFAKRELYFDALVAGIQPKIEVVEEVASTTDVVTDGQESVEGTGQADERERAVRAE